MASGMFKQQCPSCEAMVPVKDRKLIGKKIDCPNCKYRFVVEEPPDEDEGEGVKGKAKPGAKKRGVADDKPKFKPKKKDKSGSNVMLIGAGLAVLAFALLGIGAYFLFFREEDPIQVSGRTATSTQPQATNPVTTQTGPQTEPDFDLTHLLPGDSETVADIRVQDLLNISPVGSAAFFTPGAFRTATVEEATGLNISNLDRLLFAENGTQGWIFTVLHAGKPMDDAQVQKIKNLMNLKPGQGSPIQGQEFFESDYGPWVDRVAQMLDGQLGVPTAPRPERAKLAVHFYDPQTVILADLTPMRQFLEAGRKFPLAIELPQGVNTFAPTAKLQNRYRTLRKPAMKNLLDQQVKSQDCFLALAADMASIRNRERFKPLLAIFDMTPGDELEAMGLGYRQDLSTIHLVLGAECANQDQAQRLQGRLVEKGEPLSRLPFLSGLKLTLAGAVRPMGDSGDGLLGQVGFSQQQSTVLLDITVNNSRPMTAGSRWLLGQLQSRMVHLRGLMDMASTESRVHILAQRLREFAEAPENQGFPRGTVARPIAPGRFGLPWRPMQEVSWMAAMLPYLGPENGSIAGGIDFQSSWTDPKNLKMGSCLVPHFLAPGSPQENWFVTLSGLPDYSLGATHYVGVAGVGLDAADPEFRSDPANAGKLGIFGWPPAPAVKVSDLGKGGSNTIAVLQVPPTHKRPWIAGGGATVVGIPETGSVQPFVCTQYQGQKGTMALMADGSVRFIPATISDEAFKAMCTLAGSDQAPTVTQPVQQTAGQ